MALNNLVFAGNPSVIIKAGCDLVVNDKQLKKGQVLACFSDNEVEFYYRNNDESSTQGSKTILHNQEVELQRLKINSVTMSNILNTIVFGYAQKSVPIPHFDRKTTDENGFAIVDVKAQDIQVLEDDTYMPAEDIEIENNKILAKPNTTYKIYYNVYKTGYVTTAMPTSLPYFTIECIAKGKNINGDNRDNVTQVIRVNRASLNLQPFFQFNNSINKFDLDFRIIKSDGDYIIYG